MKTCELIGVPLDWAVAKALDYDLELEGYYSEELGRTVIIRLHGSAVPGRYAGDTTWSPSTDWSQGGPILQNHISELIDCGELGWEACCNGTYGAAGNTPLEAICKAYVASKLGDEVEIPEELL